MTEQKQQSLDEQLRQQRAAQGTRVSNIAITVGIGGVLLLAVGGFSLFYSGQDQALDIQAHETADRGSVVTTDQSRQQLQDAILTFEQNHQAILSNEQVAAFAPKLLQQAKFSYDSALQAFSRSDFTAAGQYLEASIEQLDSLQQLWREAVDSWYEQAQLSLTEQRPQEAQLYLERMRGLDQNDTRINPLALRIKQFDQQQALVQNYDTARIERNVAKQAEVLQQLLVLQPSNDEYQAALSAVQATLKDQQISEAVEHTQHALQQQNLAQAQAAITTLKQLQADEKTLNLLTQQLRKQQRQLSTQRTREQAVLASEQQQWQQVLALTQQYLEKAPGDSQITQLQQRASNVLAAQQGLAVYHARPERLRDSGLRQQALAAISQFQPLAQYSRTLETTISELEEHIARYTTPISVTLLSDEHTSVHIYGVDKLAPFNQQRIDLLPGTYTVEGRRTGYVSVKHTLVVSDEGAPPTLTITCTQRI